MDIQHLAGMTAANAVDADQSQPVHFDASRVRRSSIEQSQEVS
jgi:hypothetical protein